MWETYLQIFSPVLSVLVGIIVTAGVPAIFQWLSKLGLDIEARHRDALQSALQNATMLALARAGLKGAIPFEAVEYVRQSVPDAVRKFGLDDQKIIELIQPKVIAAGVGAVKPAV